MSAHWASADHNLLMVLPISKGGSNCNGTHPYVGSRLRSHKALKPQSFWNNVNANRSGEIICRAGRRTVIMSVHTLVNSSPPLFSAKWRQRWWWFVNLIVRAKMLILLIMIIPHICHRHHFQNFQAGVKKSWLEAKNFSWHMHMHFSETLKLGVSLL